MQIKASELYTIFQQSIADYHKFDSVDTPMKNPHKTGTFEALLYEKNWIDTVQWHCEDWVRSPEILPEKGMDFKRRIDALNQHRTDLVEKIDDHYWAQFQAIAPQASAFLNTESPAWAVDRLSILALKIYHTEIECQRTDISENYHAQMTQKLAVLSAQRADLIEAIDTLLAKIGAGEILMKVYRQMKMYNDLEMNPVLRATRDSQNAKP